MILVPSKGAESWRELLADPEKHWREGCSAHTLATAWEGTRGFPEAVSKLLATAPALDGALDIMMPRL